MHKFNSSILRSYDIRGVYNQTLFDKDAYYVGRSFASALNKNSQKKIAVGYDGRKSSPALKNRLIQGLLDSGIEVFEIGICPTPMLYFAVFNLDCDAGIMVTGSHNPKDHNGFKMALKDRPFYGEDITNLAKICADEDFINAKGSLASHQIINNYIDRIMQDLVIDKDSKKLSIAWDCGNGAAGDVIKNITKKITANNILLYEDIDCNFPNHHPDPTDVKNMQDLITVVKDNNCDIGIAFDGDGDRIGIVDDEGEMIWGDQLMVFYAQDILKENPQATIIADVKASNILFSEIAKAGGKPIMWKTGHSLIKAKMKQENALLAGEMSGHIFFSDKYYGFDDAIYAAIRIINILIESGKKLSDLRKSLPKTFSTPEIRISCADNIKFNIIDKIKDDLDKSGLKYNDVDGIRFIKDNDWWLLRASNTQPALVARCESVNPENLAILKQELVNILTKFDIIVPQELRK